MIDKQIMPNGGYKLKPIGSLNSQYKGGLVTNYIWMKNNCELGLSLTDISILSNRGKRTVARWLEKHDLKTKKNRKFNYGKNHHNYNGSKICKCGNKKSHGSKSCRNCYFLTRKPKYKCQTFKDLVKYVRNNICIEWRKNIFKRDNFTCQKCNDDKGGNLQAHHIKRLEVILNEIINSNKNLNISELEDIVMKNEELLSLGNGITLCKKCHTNTHKGKRKDICQI